MQLKKEPWPPILLLLLVLGTVLFMRPWPQPALASEGTPQVGRDIVVTGQASLPTDPSAALDLTVETRAAEGGTAQNDNRRAVDRVEASLKALGVSTQDILEGPYRLIPIRTTEGSQFLASQILRVSVGQKESIGEVIDAAMRSGATTASGVSTEPKGLPPQKLQALLSQAVSNARTKALAVAQAFGVRLGAPERIAVTGEGPRVGPGGKPSWGITVEVFYRF